MALHVAAQDKVKLSGRVIDDEQNPVLFAVVKVDGQAAGTTTDLQGRYQLEFSTADTVTVSFSMIGYVTKKKTLVRPKGSLRLNITLQTQSIDMGEVTVKEVRRQMNSTQHLNAENLKRLPSTTGNAVEELVAAAGDDAFSCIFLEGEDIYLNCINDLTRAFMKDLNLPLPPVRPASHALGREIYQAITFLDRDNEHLLLDRAPHLKTTRWHPHFLDVIPPTGGKDKGMDAILEHFGIPGEESMAFGDGENDLSMLVHAGIGVAMGTASDEVKRQADWATASVDEDGIVKALQHFQVCLLYTSDAADD